MGVTRGAGEVTQIVHGKGQIRSQTDASVRFASIFRLNFSKIRGAFFKQIGQTQERPGPFARRFARPTAIVKGSFGRLHRHIDISRTGVHHGGNVFTRGWILNRQSLAALAVVPRTVDPEFVIHKSSYGKTELGAASFS